MGNSCSPAPAELIPNQKEMMTYQSETQSKNIAWMLPRPKPDHYKGGMPLYAEKWLLQLARDIIGKQDVTILNLFCGMNTEGFRVDINPDVNPDLVCDIHSLGKHMPLIGRPFDIILADPPYSDEESKELYGTPRINYKKWTSEALQYLHIGGLFIVYHKYIMPNPDPQRYEVVKRVFIGNRVYHLPRVAIYFRRTT
jgi:hypothetical protein